VQGAPSRPVYPTLHLHDVYSTLPGLDPEPCAHERHVSAAVAPVSVGKVQVLSAQLAHSADPEVPFHVPAGQRLHEPPSAPV